MGISDMLRRLVGAGRRPQDPSDFDTGVDVAFARMDSRGLKPIAVVAQCLDNQWVTQDLLRRMLAKRLSFASGEVASRRLTDARAEYLRALLNAEQVVINRAFFFNNPAVYNDFLETNAERDTFKNMLNTSVIVPYLLTEASPGEPTRFSKDKVGWPAWKQLMQETHPHCVRLSWNDTENADSVNRYLVQRSRRFLATLGVFDPDGLRRDLGLDGAEIDRLMRTLREVAVWAMSESDLTREKFYKRFVVVDDPALGQYDRSKPFAGELKQLMDLRYNTNLPDALDRYPITPTDSLHRTALQEEHRARPGDDPVAPADLLQVLLRRRVFDLVQQPLHVSLTGIELSHVWSARHTEEWHNYIRNLQALMRQPEEFGDLAQAVYTSYVGLATQLAERVGERRAENGQAWAPTIQLVIEVLGATISIVFGENAVVKVVGTVAEEVAARASTAVIRFVIASHDRRVASHELATGVEIMRVKFARTRDDWTELIGRLNASGVPVRHARSEEAEVDDSAIDGLSDPEDGP